MPEEPYPLDSAESPPYMAALRLTGVRCVVVGGGAVAERKIASLLECGAQVVVFSPMLTPQLRSLADAGRITWQARGYASGDIVGARLVCAATDDVVVNARVAAEAQTAGIWVNVADAPERGDFSVPATLRRGDLTVAISTTGGAPGYARRLRELLEATIGPEYGAALELYASARPAILASERARQAALWDALFALDLPGVVRVQGHAEAQRILATWLEQVGLS